MRIGSRHSPLAALFAGAATGAYDLPDSLLDNQSRVGALQHAVAALRPPNAEQTARGEAVQALLADPDARDVARSVMDARQVDLDHELHATLLREAVEAAQDRLDVVDGDVILIDLLQPAHREVLGQLRAAYEVFSPVGMSASELWNQPDRVRKAWSAFDAAATRYEALRAAHRAIRTSGFAQSCQLDTGDLLAEVRNLDVVWPQRTTGMMPVSTMSEPWPARVDTLGWLLWAHQANAELWLPTAGEQDAQWSVIFGERAAAHAAGEHHGRQMRELFG